MNFMKTMALGLLASSFLTSAAHASSILELGDTSPAEISSIISLGDPDPCANSACGTDEPVVEEASNDKNAALVDSYGMPTNMPVIMRPSVNDGTPAAPVAATPAADPKATTTPATTTPATPAAPAPVASTPTPPAAPAAPAAPTPPKVADPSNPM